MFIGMLFGFELKVWGWIIFLRIGLRKISIGL